MNKIMIRENLSKTLNNIETIKESLYYYKNCKSGTLHKISQSSLITSIFSIFAYTEEYLKIVLKELNLGDYITDLDSSIDVALSRNLFDKDFSIIIKKNKNIRLQYLSIITNQNIEELLKFYSEIDVHYKKQIQLVEGLLD